MAELQAVVGKRIRVARKRLGLTQKALAEQAGISVHQTLSLIEKGQREARASELAALAKALKVEVSSLLIEKDPEPRAFVLWRERPKEGREVIEADFVKRCQDYATLEQLADDVSPDALPLAGERIDAATFPQAKRLAAKARRELDLGSRPATSLAGVLEDRYGVKLWYEDLGDDGSAASTMGSFGYAVLLNSIEPPWRRNFSLAHELFHLLTWESIPPSELMADDDYRKNTEKHANAFASSLLLPEDHVLESYHSRVKNGVVQYMDLIDIAREFDVSTSALLYRLVGLKCFEQETVDSLLADSAFRAMDRTTMRGRWGTPPALPERFVRLAFTAYQRGRLSRARLARYLGTSLVDLTDELLEYGLDDREDYKTEVRTAGC